jgi:O-acetyl-ADP-ribose deacetylase (regulator of RNase III)
MIKYLKGDATRPQTEGNAIIVHVCNDIGAWGAGFVLAISKRWPQPEAAYRACAKELSLGKVQFVRVDPSILVANLVGQHKIRRVPSDPTPVRYHAIRKGLARVREVAILQGASVHMPRIGCGLAGGLWEEVEDLILTELDKHGVSTYVYDFG